MLIDAFQHLYLLTPQMKHQTPFSKHHVQVYSCIPWHGSHYLQHSTIICFIAHCQLIAPPKAGFLRWIRLWATWWRQWHVEVIVGSGRHPDFFGPGLKTSLTEWKVQAVENWKGKMIGFVVFIRRWLRWLMDTGYQWIPQDAECSNLTGYVLISVWMRDMKEVVKG